MNVFDVPLALSYTKFSLRTVFSQNVYIPHGQAGKQYTNLLQDISKVSIIIVYDEFWGEKSSTHVYYFPVLIFYIWKANMNNLI